MNNYHLSPILPQYHQIYRQDVYCLGRRSPVLFYLVLLRAAQRIVPMGFDCACALLNRRFELSCRIKLNRRMNLIVEWKRFVELHTYIYIYIYSCIYMHSIHK